MSLGIPIAIDLARGEARIGEVVLGVAEAGSRGELRVGGPEGPVLRPLAFGERTRIVTYALATSDPRESVCAGILRAATVSPGAFDTRALEVMALILAGAACPEAPSFADALLLVARGAGWTPGQLAEAEAAEVDRLAIHLGGAHLAENSLRRGVKWNRLVFPTEKGTEMEAARAELADDLLARAEIGPAALRRELEESASPEAPASFSHRFPDSPAGTAHLAERRTEKPDSKLATGRDEEQGMLDAPASLGRGPRLASFSYRFPDSPAGTAHLAERRTEKPDSKLATGRDEERGMPEAPASPGRGLKLDFASISGIDSGIARLAEKRTEMGGVEPQRCGGVEECGVGSQTARGGRASGEPHRWTGDSHGTDSPSPAGRPLARSLLLSSPAWFEDEGNPLSEMRDGVFGIAEALAMLLHEEADLRGLDP